jgi:hypothetical protein
MMKKRIFVIFAFAGSIFLISGCDTLQAIRSGDLRTRDVIRMNRMDSMGAARVEDTADIGEGEEPKEARPVGTVTGIVKKADNWFRDNLW